MKFKESMERKNEGEDSPLKKGNFPEDSSPENSPDRNFEGKNKTQAGK